MLRKQGLIFSARCSASLALLLLSASLCLAAPLRIVSLTSPATETIYMLGAEASLVGVTDVCVFPEQVMKDRENGRVRVVGQFAKVNFAMIDEIKPDVIFTSTAFQRDMAKQLRAKGYKVIHQEPGSLSDVLKAVEEIGDAIGKAEQARQFTARSLAPGMQPTRRESRAARSKSIDNHEYDVT